MGRIILYLWLAICTYIPISDDHSSKKTTANLTNSLQSSLLSFSAEASFLRQQAPGLNEKVITKVVRAIQCAQVHHVEHNGILTIIDYSLPSSEKRLWVVDLKTQKLLFHTYVAHGLRSGARVSNFFSNKNNSRASSIGVYRTEKAYYGREGLSLRLDGLERAFNDNASSRSIVMHGGWYVEEDFIKKYGRAGRSWGCPALPLALYQPIIKTIKDSSLFVVYYPSDKWLAESRFLHCDSDAPSYTTNTTVDPLKLAIDEKREPVLITSLRHKGPGGTEEGSAIVAMSADSYAKTFHTTPPLTRMLRRQIEASEYIALSTSEFATLAGKAALDEIRLVAPYLVMVHGYYETKMKIVPLGKITKVENTTLHFDSNKTLSLYSTDQFIRWLGL